MDSLPLVSIICLCYNQKRFVAEAINSVLSQTYQKIELIIVDDASTDGSQEEIKSAIAGHAIKLISLDENQGNCRAFNLGFQQSHGKFIIDLAAGDVLLPNRVEEGINDFLNAPKSAGVQFSDAFLMNESGEILNTHYRRDRDGKITEKIPTGNIYEQLTLRYFICPPTMMVKRTVLTQLHGYDEQLTYEDFDFWVRSSRQWHYIFNRAPLVKKRNVRNSLGKAQTKFKNAHQSTTFLVCQKIYDLNRKPSEYKALINRCKYEIGQCVKAGNLKLVGKYLKLISASKLAYRRLSSASNMEM